MLLVPLLPLVQLVLLARRKLPCAGHAKINVAGPRPRFGIIVSAMCCGSVSLIVSAVTYLRTRGIRHANSLRTVPSLPDNYPIPRRSCRRSGDFPEVLGLSTGLPGSP